MNIETNINEIFSLEDFQLGSNFMPIDKQGATMFTIIWNKGDRQDIEINNEILSLEKNSIIFLAELYDYKSLYPISLRIIQFNRAFHCVANHDSKIGCKGLLFYSYNKIPLVTIPQTEVPKYESLWKNMYIEIRSPTDDFKTEMLQILLKRFLILSTRLYKVQNANLVMHKSDLDIIREFSFLVEVNFREKKSVSDYAEMLNKAPKSLANLFAKISDKTPLQIIHQRIMTEAERLLAFSEKQIQEIAHDLGFEDINSFSRFFKNKKKQSPKSYREKLRDSCSEKLTNTKEI